MPEPQNLTAVYHLGQGVLHLELVGDVTPATADALRVHLDSLARAVSDGTTRVVIDLRRVDRFSDIGVPIIAELESRLLAGGLRISVEGRPQQEAAGAPSARDTAPPGVAALPAASADALAPGAPGTGDGIAVLPKAPGPGGLTTEAGP